jgi:sugar phosphate isomerase/epimerase
MSVISVSTAWNALRHESAEGMIGELRSLGFSVFELNVQISEDMMREIEAMLPEIEITSLHNFCPVPEGSRDRGSGDFYLLSSPDPIERQKAVDGTMRTIEWAHRLGAKAIVLHMGRVPIETHHEEICDLRLAGFYEKADDKLRYDLALRESIRDKYLDASLKSASELAGKVAGDVLLGIESRIVYHEIPNVDEIALFMQAVPPSAGGYWHDFGHAHQTEVVGTGNHETFISRYADRIIGMHIHDSLGRHDHGPLTHGTIDFGRFLPRIPESAISVLEIHKHASAEELVKSREIWESLVAGNQAQEESV